MGNLYNARVSFKGEGSFTFVLPRYGDLTVYNGRDIFIKGLDVPGVEALRQLRPLLLEHQLNAKPDGCYKVLDLSNYVKPQPFERAYKPEVKTVADLKAQLIKSNGPIVKEEEVKPQSTQDSPVEKPVEQPKPEQKPEPKPVKTQPKTQAKRNNSKKKNKR